ncbi:MAG: orotate phosphoribosyltransferase [Desulfobaccales bacterium]
MSSREGEPGSRRERLRQLLKQKSFLYRPQLPFRLASGRESPYYIDCRPTTHNGQGLFLIGEIFWEMFQGLQVEAVGGLTLGADPMAHAIALTSFLKGRPLNAFSVRKEAKGHGTGGLLVGDVQPGDRVVILEDVITSGASTLKAIAAARDFGLQVVKVLILVDRQEGGREAVAAAVPQVEALFTLADLKNP